ncbi:MAG: hypothetical protein M1479_08480 [Actinobacteria bacterium]|nr:hypothetical protein [Cyanobacteriota bacterium]MCL5772294.1 hypothetical protein [Actinomycetota bacterium]
MENENEEQKQNYHGKKDVRRHSGSGVVGVTYFMAFVGAAVFYIQPTTTFGAGLVGFLKALVWPGFLIYDLLKFLSK